MKGVFMKKSVFRILVCVIILSLALPPASNIVLAEGDEPPAPTSFVPDRERFESLQERFVPDNDLLKEHPYPPEVAVMFPGEAQIPEPREYTPPSPEVIALTQQQVQSFDCGTVTDVPQTECEALVALYNSTNGAGWTISTNWLVTPTVDDWYRVGVEGGHVASIGLYSNNLNGSIPPELGNLTNLMSLKLYSNQLIGSIPYELGNLPSLVVLYLHYNQLSGPIPPELGNLTNLTTLSLYSNQLSGSIPPQLGNLTNLVELRLNGNYLEGSIPPSFVNLTKLVYLSLAGNVLTGNIPLELGNLANLEYLYLRFNDLSGVIPSTLENLTKLKTLSLQGNQLVGEIPSELGNLTQLDYLELAENNLSGQIPSELGQLTNLTGIWMGANLLSGPIPSEIFGLTNLVTIGLWDNYLTGSIPPEIGNLLSLNALWLDNNDLSGSIPQEIGLLTNLQYLDIQSNRFSGNIPVEVGNLINLTQFDISNNMLSGDVPSSFTNLVNLCVSGNPDHPCYGLFATDLGYNHLNVPALEPGVEDFLAIKDPDWYLTQAVEEVIPGDIGGTVVSNDGNTEIAVPPGAVEGLLTILFAPQPNPNEGFGVLNFAGNSFELTASIGEGPVESFAQPLTLTLQYDQASLGVIPEDTLILYYWDTIELAWLDAASTCAGGIYTRNLDENWLSLPICHLSEFALLGDSFDLFLPSIRR